MQVLEDGRGRFYTWNCWGRLGDNGRSNLQKCAHAETAIVAFEKKFRDKTKNSWSDRDNFVKKDRSYQLVETDPDDDGEGGGDAALGKQSCRSTRSRRGSRSSRRSERCSGREGRSQAWRAGASSYCSRGRFIR